MEFRVNDLVGCLIHGPPDREKTLELAEWIRVTMDKELRSADSFQIRPPADWLTRMVNDEEQDPTVSSRIDQILYGE